MTPAMKKLCLFLSLAITFAASSFSTARVKSGKPRDPEALKNPAVKHSKEYCATCERDNQGRIKVNSAEKKRYLKSQGYDRVPEGMEVRHITPLSKGGQDVADNMTLVPKVLKKGRK